tara:strand:+ start:2793 stop:4094 length:1302 start_codon:yes stop_codon:yes gene_type:complete
MNSEIDIVQSSLILKSKKYLSKCKKKGIEIASSPYCDLTTWINSIGYQKVLLIKNNKFLSKNYIKYFFLECINVGRFKFNYNIYTNNLHKKKKINIIYSYSWRENFKNEIFYDNYFKVNSQDSNFFFILVSIDGFLPKKVKNCLIIKRTKTFFNPIIFLDQLIKKAFCKNFFHRFNSTNIFNEFIQNIFEKEIPKKRANILIPYESRPHQNALVTAAKKNNNKNNIICYLHNMPWPFQLDMIYKGVKIDKLLVCSNIQKEVFKNNYFWPKKILNTIPSLRFNELRNRKKTIFLPFDLTEDNQKLLEGFKVLISKISFDIEKYKISIHPLKKFSRSHINLKKELLKIIKSSKKNNIKMKTVDPIIFSHPGGTATECLQVCNSVYHITSDKLHVFSKRIWKSIKILKIEKNVYKYVSRNTKFLILDKKKSIKNII